MLTSILFWELYVQRVLARGAVVVEGEPVASTLSDSGVLSPLFTRSWPPHAKAQEADMDTKNMTGPVRTVYIVAYPGAEILDITGPMEVFAFANGILQQWPAPFGHGVITEPAYQIALLAEKPGPVMTSCGLEIIAGRTYSE